MKMARKILVVDDNEINRQLLINVLHNDYDIIEASDGREALELIHRNYKVLSAVLLDIIMPEVDGNEVLRRMRENALLSQIPVIMITGSDDDDTRVNALSLGANDFILKPFNAEIVKHCLHNCIALRETASILNAIQKDKLTGLYNRETFFDKADTMIREHEPGHYILSCFDIDNFKLINDQHGTAEGDRILKEVANAVKRNMDDIGGLAGRISSDNFVVLLPAEKSDTDVLERIQKKTLVLLERQPIVFSVGRYYVIDCKLSASTIYDRAYIAKQSVKGRFDKHLAYFDDTMLQKLVRDQQIVGEMENALTEHQFEVWFQPQYNQATWMLIGAEALVRWRHPQKGIVSPGEFIPLFEQNGFIYELDKYVWRETCCLLRKWIDQSKTPPPVSINISRYDVFRPDLIDVIVGLTKEFNIPVDLLRLEITESAFAKSTKIIVDIVKQLVSLGFVVEIDDFGSGYSSLNTLKSVPAQVVKLDMRFLEDEDDSQRGGNIIESVVRMAKWLGMSVIAEGVETKEQSDFLKSIGCIQVQGYLYARPMSAADFEEYLLSSEKDEHLIKIVTVENLDNNMFWNPYSMDTLIFNSYVGSACICEYYEDTLEILRATDKFVQVFCKDGMAIDVLTRINLFDYIERKDRNAFVRKINKSISDKSEIICECLFINVPGCPREVCLRSTMRVIASAGGRHLIYCISENITKQRVLEQGKRQLTTQLKAVMDNIDCGITAVTIKDEKSKILLANDKYFELIGYTRGQYKKEIGSNAFLTIHPHDVERVKAIVKTLNNNGDSASMEYRVVRRDGSSVWMRSLLSIAKFEDVESNVLLCTYSDITAERNTSQTLLDNLPCGAGICLINGKDAYMTYLNKRYYSYFNHYSRASQSSSVFDIIHPDDCMLLREAMRPALLKGGEGSCVVRIRDGEDEYITFRLTGVSMEAENSNNAIYVTFVPISYEELSFDEMIPVALNAVMASSSDLSFVKDKNLKYICCSREFAKMVGLKDEKDIVGKSDYDLFSKKFADKYASDDRSLIKSKKSIVDMIENIPSADGKSRYSCTSKYLLFDSCENIVGIYGLGRDVTLERKAQARRDFLIDSIPGGVAVYEGKRSMPDGIKLTYFSDGFCKLFGYERDEYQKIGEKNPVSLVAKEDMSQFGDSIKRLVEENRPLDVVYRATAKDGRLLWIHVKAVVAEKSGDNLTVNAVLFDVTERQNALEKLRISEEENRMAIRHSKNIVCRYDISSKSLSVSANANPIFELTETVENVPYGQVKEGKISSETSEAYTKFYEDILNGKKSGHLIYQRKSTMGWRWLEARSSTIFSSEGNPVSAVISFADVTERLAL